MAIGEPKVITSMGSHRISKMAPITAFSYTLKLFPVIRNSTETIKAISSIRINLAYLDFFKAI